MDSYQSMRAALAPTGLYADAGAIAMELWAYAQELDRVYEELDEILDDGFIITAGAQALGEIERIFGPERVATLAQRRQMLLQRIPLGNGSFTPEQFMQGLASLGLQCEVAEYPHLNRMNILAQGNYTEAEKSFITAEVQKLSPAHLEVQVVFNTLTWQQWDDRNRDFSTLDQQNLTWDQIDSQSAS